MKCRPPTDVVEALARLADTDVDTLDTAGVTQFAATLAVIRGWIDDATTRLAARAGALHAEGVCGEAAAVLAAAGRLAGRDARHVERRAEFLATAPGVAAAFSTGSLTADHVDAVVRLAADLDSTGRGRLADELDDLVLAGRSMPVDRFERTCRDIAHDLSGDDGISELERQRCQTRVRTRHDRRTGMCHLQGQFEPEVGAKLINAIDAEVDALRQAGAQFDGGGVSASAGPPASAPIAEDGVSGAVREERLAARALANLVIGERCGAGLSRPEVLVVIDSESLATGTKVLGGCCELSNGHPVPVAVARRLLCEAAITIAVRSGDNVLHLGRRERVANRAQRRALRALYRTCAFDACQVPFDRCHIHHLEFWERFGSTDLWNLVPVCEHHHHLVHEGGWALRLAPDRSLTIIRPDGVVHAVARPDMPPPPRRSRRTTAPPRFGTGPPTSGVGGRGRSDPDGRARDRADVGAAKLPHRTDASSARAVV